MITYSPSYIALTPKKSSESITINGELSKALTYSNIRLVVLAKQGETLKERECDTVIKADLISLTSTTNRATVGVSVNPDISAKLKGCIAASNEFLAVSIDVPKTKASNVSASQRVVIPLFDGTSGNLLTKTRTGEVLGALTQNLRVSDLSCQKNYFFSAEDLHCQSTITNATDTGLLANILTTLREGLPPALTKYENIERTNILLLPGQSYTLNFVIPSSSFNLLKNDVSVITTFSPLGTDGASFTANEEYSIWYTPVLLIVLICGFLVTLSAILLRNGNNKLTARKNGFKKTNTSNS